MNIKVRVKEACKIAGAERAVGARLSLNDVEAYQLADEGKVEILKVSPREEAQAAAEKEQNEKDEKARAEAEKEAARKAASEKAAVEKADKAASKTTSKAE